MKRYVVTFETEIIVEVDETKFTDEFMEEYRDSFYQFYGIEDHIEHLAELKARGVYELSKYIPDEFVEGYGPIGEFGISASSYSIDLVDFRELS